MYVISPLSRALLFPHRRGPPERTEPFRIQRPSNPTHHTRPTPTASATSPYRRPIPLDPPLYPESKSRRPNGDVSPGASSKITIDSQWVWLGPGERHQCVSTNRPRVTKHVQARSPIPLQGIVERRSGRRRPVRVFHRSLGANTFQGTNPPPDTPLLEQESKNIRRVNNLPLSDPHCKKNQAT